MQTEFGIDRDDRIFITVPLLAEGALAIHLEGSVAATH